MSDLTFHWFLPTNGGDGRHVVGGGHGVGPVGRAAGIVAYLGQVARAAEDARLRGGADPDRRLVRGRLGGHRDADPDTPRGSSSWSRSVPACTRRPSPRRWPATFQTLSGGRLLLNVVTGGEIRRAAAATATSLGKDERYARADEFLDRSSRGSGAASRSTSRASTCEVEGARLARSPTRCPTIYFGGSSPAAADVAARHADVYLTWGEPPPRSRRRSSGARGGRGPGARAPLRHPPARDLARHRRGGLGRGRSPARPA